MLSLKKYHIQIRITKSQRKLAIRKKLDKLTILAQES
jgi:hypothetical protein